VDSGPHDWLPSPLFFLSAGLTVQRTKSGKSGHRILLLCDPFAWACGVRSWARERSPWSRGPARHPIGPPARTPGHVTQTRGFVRRPRCLNARYIWRGLQWIQSQATECHCLLLLDKQQQTQTGLCELDTIVELVSLWAGQPVAGQRRGHTHTHTHTGSFALTRAAVAALKQRGSRPTLKRWVIGRDGWTHHRRHVGRGCYKELVFHAWIQYHSSYSECTKHLGCYR